MKKYPVAEIFTSPQGEGLYTGTLMTFIRLAGCSVGKKLTPDDMQRYKDTPFGGTAPGTYPVLNIYTEKCCTYDGREFLCDTDFRTQEALTAPEILERVPKGVEHICLTGGEPLIHDLMPLIIEWRDRRGAEKKTQELSKNDEFEIHIETSGTIMVPDELYNEMDLGDIWITVSPKLGVLNEMLDLAMEVKILVDENFDEAKLPPELLANQHEFWIQPINFEHSIDVRNMQKVLELQKKHPNWRISTQMHKLWRVR